MSRSLPSYSQDVTVLQVSLRNIFFYYYFYYSTTNLSLSGVNNAVKIVNSIDLVNCKNSGMSSLPFLITVWEGHGTTALISINSELLEDLHMVEWLLRRYNQIAAWIYSFLSKCQWNLLFNIFSYKANFCWNKMYYPKRGKIKTNNTQTAKNP